MNAPLEKISLHEKIRARASSANSQLYVKAPTPGKTNIKTGLFHSRLCFLSMLILNTD